MPKQAGGVGIKSLKHMNEAFILKSIWRLHTNSSDLWAQVLIGKYGRTWREGGQILAKPTDSRLWKAMVKNWDLFEQNIARIENHHVEESFSWRATGHGEFTTKSAYAALTGHNGEANMGPWKAVWKLKVPERIRVFLWCCLHKKLPTNEVTSKWDGGSGCCTTCLNQREDILHALRECPNAIKVWRAFVPVTSREDFFGSNWKEWIEDNLLHRLRVDGDPLWPEIFAVSCSHLWQWRNLKKFSPNFEWPQDSVCLIRQYLGNYLSGWDMQKGGEIREHILKTSWQAPKQGCVKLNTDGALHYTGVGGFGGVIRGADGRWICGFSGRGATSDSLGAEAWGLLQGLELCWDKGYRHIEVEVDAKQLVDMFKGQQPARALLMPWSAIWELLQRNWKYEVNHIYREANCCADAMAALGIKQQETYKVWDEPPGSLGRLLIVDTLDFEATRIQRVLV